MLTNDQLDQIETFAVERCAAHDAAHDVLHLRRVLTNARAIVIDEVAAGSSVRGDVVEAACWLHDLVQLPKGEGAPGTSARLSASAARSLLGGMSVCADTIERIAHAIEAHSFSGGMTPHTVEAAIVQDADRLDALGAIGIARLWITAATLGSYMYDDRDPLGSCRTLDDRAYGLDHIERKLLSLSATMNTRGGRTEAERRARHIVEYRAAFLRELGVNVESQSGAP